MLRIKVEGATFTDGQLAQLEGKFSQPPCNIAEIMAAQLVASGHGHANKHLTTRSSRTQCQAVGLSLRRLAPTLENNRGHIMKAKIIAISSLLLITGVAYSQDYLHGQSGTSYNNIGGTTFGSDGSSSRQIGGTTFNSDGSSSRQIGGTTFTSDGSSSRQIGNTLFNSDGSTVRKIGDSTFGSDGTSCRKIGSRTFCN